MENLKAKDIDESNESNEHFVLCQNGRKTHMYGKEWMNVFDAMLAALHYRDPTRNSTEKCEHNIRKYCCMYCRRK